MQGFGKFVTFIVTTVLTVLLQGWIIAKFWAWFIIPIFPVKPLSLIQAIGFSMFVSLMIFKVKPDEKESTFVEHLKMLLLTVITLLLIWGIGWFIHLFY